MENSIISRLKISPQSILLLAILAINIIGLTSIYLKISSTSSVQNLPLTSNTKPQVTPPPTSDVEQLKAEMAQLRAETRQLKSVLGSKTTIDTLSETLPDLELVATQSVKISDPRFNTIDVHELPIASSKVIGQLDYDVSYPFTSRQGEWYQVMLSNGTYGWVSSQLVKPI
jgi:hypothetical protein